MKIILGLAALMLIVGSATASDRAENAYKTHKLTTASVLVSCNDEREPVIERFANKTFIMVTCTPVK